MSRANTHALSSSIFNDGGMSDGRFPLLEKAIFWRRQRDRLRVLFFTIIKRAWPPVINTVSSNKVERLKSNLNRITSVKVPSSTNLCRSNCIGLRTFRQRRFGKKSMPKHLRLKTFAETIRKICGAYSVYARSPSSSQRPAPTTMASRSPFPLNLCSCSTSLSKLGI